MIVIACFFLQSQQWTVNSCGMMYCYGIMYHHSLILVQVLLGQLPQECQKQLICAPLSIKQIKEEATQHKE